MSDLASPVDQRLVLTVTEAAQLLGVGRSLLYRLLEMGEIPSLTVGRCRRVRPEDLKEYVDRRALRAPDSATGY